MPPSPAIGRETQLEGAGAGIHLRAGQLTAAQVRAAAERLLRDSGYREGAGRLMRLMQAWNTGKVFIARGQAQLEH